MEYLRSVQNICEVFLLSSTQAVLVLQHLEYASQELLRHMLGWSIFLAWINMSIILGRFDVFGKHIYRSWVVIKNVVVSILVYVPFMIAFSMAFHVFLSFNEVFEGNVASLLKVITMVLGEYDFQDNFLYDKVVANHGSLISVQILFVMFVIVGSLIGMNLITAWVVNV